MWLQLYSFQNILSYQFQQRLWPLVVWVHEEQEEEEENVCLLCPRRALWVYVSKHRHIEKRKSERNLSLRSHLYRLTTSLYWIPSKKPVCKLLCLRENWHVFSFCLFGVKSLTSLLATVTLLPFLTAPSVEWNKAAAFRHHLTCLSYRCVKKLCKTPKLVSISHYFHYLWAHSGFRACFLHDSHRLAESSS